MDKALYEKYSKKLYKTEYNKVNLCRVCMVTEKDITPPIEWSEWQNLEIMKHFEDITRIKLNTSDSYPKLICSQCIEWLNDTDKMIRMLREVDQFWNLFMSKNEQILLNNQNDVKDYTEIEYLSYSSEAENELIKLEYSIDFLDTQSRIGDGNPVVNSQSLTEEDNDTLSDDDAVENYDENKIEFIDMVKKDIIKKLETSKKRNTIKPMKLKQTICSYCKLKFRSKAACEFHARELHNPSYNREGESICHYCDFSFPLKSSLIEHIELIHRGYEKNEFYCKVCKRSFLNMFRYKLHIRMAHLANRKFQCDMCAQVFLQKKDIRSHMALHSDELGFVCDVCGVVINTKASLKRHKINQHTINDEKKPNSRPVKIKIPPEKRQYLCSLCDKRLGTMLSLKCHMSVKHRPTGSEAFRKLSTLWCLKCNVCFNSMDERDQHRGEFHVLEPRSSFNKNIPKDGYLQCDICKQYFRSKDTLKVHQSLHSVKDRPFKCTKCGASYTRKIHLAQHINRIHTTEKPFECNMCEWKFSVKYELSNHIRIVHTREMNYRCHFCDVIFTSTAELNNHRMEKHKNQYRYACEECDRKFKTSAGYYLHKRKHD